MSEEREIPDDVMATARAVRDRLCMDSVCTFDAGCGCLTDIARAILAERERCAKVAESLPGQRGNSPEHLVGRTIATAIRSGQ